MWAVLPRARRALSWRVVPVAAAYAAMLVLFTLANKTTTAANAVFLQYVAPAWVILLAPRFLGEPFARRDGPFVAAIAAGMVCFFLGERDPQATAPDPLLGNLYALAASGTLAASVIGLRWLAQRTSSSSDPAAAAPALGNALAFLVCLPGLTDPTRIAPADWGWILYLGTIQIGLAYVFLTRAAPRLPAFELSLLLLVEPVLNPVWAAAVHGERPGLLAVVGGGLVVVALAWRTLREQRAGRA